MTPEAAETIALQALAWLAANDELWPVFLGASGSSAEDAQAGARDPAYLGSVLEFLTMDDNWVMAFCDDGGPEIRYAAARPLCPSGGRAGALDMSAPTAGLTGVRGVVFDKDGTLFDFNATWAVWTAGLIEDTAPDAATRAAMAQVLGFDLQGRSFLPGSIVIAETSEMIAHRLLPFFADMTAADLARRLNDRAARTPQAPVLPLVPFLARLRQAGLRLGVATNDGEGPARTHLEGEGAAHLFDFIAGYDSGHGGKPAPGQLLAFVTAQGLTPGDCVMVGDSLHDLHAGAAAGMRTVGVLTGVADRADLAPAADLVLDSIAGLPDALGL